MDQRLLDNGRDATRALSKLVVVFAAALMTGCATVGQPVAEDIHIVDKPVPFPAERIELTKQYIREHYGRDVKNIEIVPRIIVLHWTGGSSFNGSYNTFVPTTIEGARTELARTSALNVGIQFLVDRDGTIYRLMPETWMARHVIGLNYNAIGVENVGGRDDVANLTDAQVAANIQLVRYLTHKYSTIQYLIGHMEYRDFEGHPLWLERDNSYRTGKSDPGEDFMSHVRAGVAELHLKGPAEIAHERKK